MRWTILALACCAAILTPALRAAGPAQKHKFEDEIKDYEVQDKEHPPAAGGVLFVGSSSIRIWDLKKSFPQLDAINRGFGGSQIADCLYYAKRIVAPYKPRLIVFYAGDNDLAAKKTPEQVRDDFQGFVETVRGDLPKTPIIFISIKPCVARWKLYDSVQTANALVKKYCEQHDGLRFLDITAAMLDADGKPRPELFKPDGLHMNEAGYKIWAEALQPVIDKTAPKK